MMKYSLIFCFISLTLYGGCTAPPYSRQDIEKLNGLPVGNGITLHPTEKWMLISRPSEFTNKANGKPFYKIYFLELGEDGWGEPQTVFFESRFNDYHPVISPDGKWVYFNSDRPPPGEILPAEKMNIWRVAIRSNAFSTPEYLTDINTEHHESYPSVTGEGVLYFNSDRPGGKGSMDFYRASPVGNGFSAPELVTALNSADSENDLTIDPLERFVVFNRYLFDAKEVDLFISSNKGGSWSVPVPLNKVNKAGVWELTPTLPPDGTYLLLEVDGKIQVSLMDDILE
jgi:hypothetical protein